MGFLDHSTNNIIIDAVLTNTGRQKLADNNGSFKIAFFSLADDEVDYSIIEQYGRAVGKEKISKNTPVFEAQTSGDIALKYRLLTLADPTVTYLPTLSVSGDGVSNENSFSLSKATNTQKSITITQKITNGNRVPDGASDQSFTLLIPDRFLRINGKTTLSIDQTTRIAQYHQQASAPDPTTNGATATFIVAVQSALSDNDFTIYGDGSTITTVISVIGDGSGIRKDMTVTISK